MIPFFCNNQLPERGAPFLIIEVRGPGTVKTGLHGCFNSIHGCPQARARGSSSRWTMYKLD